MSMSVNLNSTPASSYLSGKPLILARLAWWGIATLTFTYTIADLYVIFIEKPLLEKPLWFLTKPEAIFIKQIGISSALYGNYITTIGAVTVFIFFAAACLIFWRRSDDWQAILVSLTIIATGLQTGFQMGFPLANTHRAWLIPYVILFMIPTVGVEVMFFTFPDGRFIPRWTRWAVAPYTVFVLLRGIILIIANDNGTGIVFLIHMSLLGASLLAQIYRYRRFSNQSQRRQTKWIIYGFVLMVLITLSDTLLFPLYFPLLNGLSAKLYYFVYVPYYDFTPWFLPVLAIGFSILRYRLWDIDFIINRSLVYGALTIILAIIFGGSLFLVSLFVQGQSFIIAFGITAMIAGISFHPTRRRIQRFVDRRFYNIQIDYQKTPPDLATDSNTQVLRQTNFGVYQDLELIGKGGMAEVYRSLHPTLGVPVAIKILPPKLAAEDEFRQRFAREAQVVSKLEHPNIVRIFDSGEQDGKYYMVMEYLIGKDLDRLIKNNGRLPMTQALPFIQQIASALDYAHAEGFVHRDIKPSNVLLDTSSNNNLRAVLTDFGIAKIINAHTVMTRTGFMLGTFDYIAPEQIEESSTVDGKADIYALGVMTYQMLTGEVPFKHNHPGALLIAHLNQPPPDACEILPDLPHHIAASIQRAMAKKPEERFATATEFAMEIS